jgi:hypothetical protein
MNDNQRRGWDLYDVWEQILDEKREKVHSSQVTAGFFSPERLCFGYDVFKSQFLDSSFTKFTKERPPSSLKRLAGYWGDTVNCES